MLSASATIIQDFLDSVGLKAHVLELPDAKFSFPGLGVEGPSNIAVALFSFPSVEAYEIYRKDVPKDPEYQRMTTRFKANTSFTRYERNFLTPIFSLPDGKFFE